MNIADIATEFLGTPYVSGGTDERGFSSWGLVHRCLARAGYKDPPISGHEISGTVGKLIYHPQTESFGPELLRGDIVCFDNVEGSSTHVGILTSATHIVHASDVCGRVIVELLQADSGDKHSGHRAPGSRRHGTSRQLLRKL